MGFFKGLKKFARRIGRTVTSPKRLTTAVFTGGASVIAPRVFRPLENTVGKTLFNPSLALAVASRGTAGGLGGGRPMAFNIGGFFGGLGQVLGNVQGQNAGGLRALGGVSTILGSSLAPRVKQMPGTGNPSATTPSIRTPTGSMTRALAGVGRRFAEKFPNLAAGINAWRIQGKNVTRGKLWSMMRRFGPDFLITAGILSAAAVAELMMAGPGRRRMNPGNVRALRRSLRRLESFHHLCARADKLRRPRGRSCKTRGGSQQFVRQG